MSWPARDPRGIALHPQAILSENVTCRPTMSGTTPVKLKAETSKKHITLR